MSSSNIEIVSIWISPGHDFKGRHGLSRESHGVQMLNEVECAAGKGLVGDRFFGHDENYKGQITFFAWEVGEEVRRSLQLSDIDMSAFRRNVLTRGIDLNTLIGQTFELNSVRFFGTEECSPCHWMDEAVGPGTCDLLKNRGGLRCRILTDGVLRCGPAALHLMPDTA